MNALCWNCRGLGDSRVVQALLELIQHHRPLVVFLCETNVVMLRWYKNSVAWVLTNLFQFQVMGGRGVCRCYGWRRW
ncbi:hypothetical protein ACFX11_038915 [Malus domestica]